jgi:DNA-binding NarL/FixJ family response regulator
MIGPLTAPPIRLTRAALTQIAQRRLTVEIDDGFLEQIKRIVPALIAGYSEWSGPATATSDARVRWHWYFDEALQRFVVPPHGVQSNIILVDGDGRDAPPDALVRLILRRIRRRHDWQPWMRLATLNRRSAMPTASVAAPRGTGSQIMTPVAHRDGTCRWGKQALRELEQLPDDRKFARIAKWARELFGFQHTMAVARSRHDPNLFSIEENFQLKWREIYEREHLVLIDPRLTCAHGATTWTARALHAQNPAFWNVAMAHGIRSGWLMRSADGSAALVLSRPDPDITAQESALMTPNLVMLAHAAHDLMARQLGSVKRRGNAPYERALPENDLEIIAHLQRNKPRKAIAAMLGKSIATVDRRLRVIKDKLGVDKTTDIVEVAVQMGLLKPI